MNQMETLTVVTESSNIPSNDESTEPAQIGRNIGVQGKNQTRRESKRQVRIQRAGPCPWFPKPMRKTTQVLDETWITSIKEKCLDPPGRIKVSSTNSSTSIYRVPRNLFQQDDNAYVPHAVSIGPLHHDKREGQLQAMEEHKRRYLSEMIKLLGEAWFKQCMMAVKELENEARECYSQVIELDSNPFVEMMVLDGCFIIVLFLKLLLKVADDPHLKLLKRLLKVEDDPLLKFQWLNRELTIDLVKLENQIPFFILQKLCDLMGIPCSTLKTAALIFFRRWAFCSNILPEREKTGDSELPPIHHLLHLLHVNIVLSTEKKYPQSDETPESIQCASKLQESGIKFKRRDLNNVADNFLDIEFDREKGIIEIPLIYLGDGTNRVLRNLVAFEQCYFHDCKKYITAYTLFMDLLINTRKDVEILLQEGIIKNRLGSEKNVALLFNKINKEVILFPESFYLSGVCEGINHYCGKAWPKLRATLMHDYFKSPWAVISFLAALFLLLLTMTQTFFSGFPKFAYGN